MSGQLGCRCGPPAPPPDPEGPRRPHSTCGRGRGARGPTTGPRGGERSSGSPGAGGRGEQDSIPGRWALSGSAAPTAAPQKRIRRPTAAAGRPDPCSWAPAGQALRCLDHSAPAPDRPDRERQRRGRAGHHRPNRRPLPPPRCRSTTGRPRRRRPATSPRPAPDPGPGSSAPGICVAPGRRSDGWRSAPCRAVRRSRHRNSRSGTGG